MIFRDLFINKTLSSAYSSLGKWIFQVHSKGKWKLIRLREKNMFYTCETLATFFVGGEIKRKMQTRISSMDFKEEYI